MELRQVSEDCSRGCAKKHLSRDVTKVRKRRELQAFAVSGRHNFQLSSDSAALRVGEDMVHGGW